MIKYRASIGEWQIYSCHGHLWAALDIFSFGISMVYLKFAGRKFGILKSLDISVAVLFVPPFSSMFVGLDRKQIYMSNIMASDFLCQEPNYVT